MFLNASGVEVFTVKISLNLDKIYVQKFIFKNMKLTLFGCSRGPRGGNSPKHRPIRIFEDKFVHLNLIQIQ